MKNADLRAPNNPNGESRCEIPENITCAICGRTVNMFTPASKEWRHFKTHMGNGEGRATVDICPDHTYVSFQWEGNMITLREVKE